MVVFIKQIFFKTRHITMYAVAMGILVFVLKWLQWKYLVTDNSTDIYIGLIALIFTLLGIWVANQLVKPKIQTVVVETRTVDEFELKKLNLSAREYEVLQLITQGKSNAEIADKLFLSLSTVKTHVSNLFVKMDVKSRAQATEKAIRMRLV